MQSASNAPSPAFGTLPIPATSPRPSAAHFQAEAIAWAVRFGVISPSMRAKVEAARIGELMVRVFPGAAGDILQLVTDWTLLFFALDDAIEDPGRSRIERAALVVRAIEAVEGRADASTNALSAAVQDVRDRLATLSLACVVESFARDVTQVLQGMLLLEDQRCDGAYLSIAEYVELRTLTIGLMPYRSFADASTRTTVHASGTTLRLVERLEESAARVVGWSNDLFTYPKEHAAGDPHNLVLLWMRDGLSLDAAVRRAQRMHDRELRRFTALTLELRHRTEPQEGIGERIAFLENAIRAHAAWGQETARYAGMQQRRAAEGERDTAWRAQSGNPERALSFHR
jgi:epi-isozizaene synthase